MSVTVLEVLESAKINFETIGKMGAKNHPIFMIAMEQLNNAIAAMENGRGADFVVQENLASEVKT